MSACGDSVSVPYRSRSTRSTRSPDRASSIAVAAPATRAPTTMTSKGCAFSSIASPGQSQRSGGADVPGQLGGVVAGTVDEGRLTPALEAQPDRVQARNLGES